MKMISLITGMILMKDKLMQSAQEKTWGELSGRLSAVLQSEVQLEQQINTFQGLSDSF